MECIAEYAINVSYECRHELEEIYNKVKEKGINSSILSRVEKCQIFNDANIELYENLNDSFLRFSKTRECNHARKSHRISQIIQIPQIKVDVV